MRSLGCDVHNLNEWQFIPQWRSWWLRGIRRALRRGIVREFNRAFQERVALIRPDLVFVFKGVLMEADSLRVAREYGARLFNFYPDVDLVSHYRWFGNDFLGTVPLYDCIFTPKRYHFDDLRAAGAQRIEFLPYAYDPECHRRVAPTPADQELYGTDVVVVATWGKQRAAMLERLVAGGFPHRLTVWGDQWYRLDRSSPLRPYVRFRAITGIEMALAFACSKIALAFLAPPDQHTARTFEIPAFGAFMLAERTPEHLEFFREDEEIACFGDLEEMRTKIDYYLAHDNERRGIAAAGYQLVVAEHSYKVRMACVLEVLQEYPTHGLQVC